MLFPSLFRFCFRVIASLVPLVLSAEVVQLHLTIKDEDEQRLPARVLVLDAAERSHLPPSAITTNIGPDTWFACDGVTRLDVPAGDYRIRIERGPEFLPVFTTLSVRTRTSHAVTLKRWIDLRALGYVAGENHLHVAPAALPALLASEGLDIGTSLFWWNGPRLPLPDTPHSSGEKLTLFDAEIENAWGALYCVGLREPMPVAWDAARANVAFARAGRERGALNCYQGGWSPEVLVDALLGLVDVVNLNDNLFQRHKVMPRARYSNLLNTPGLPVYPDTGEGMLQLVTASYYRLLNCGLRLAAGAGSATGVKSTPAGYNRSYVQTPTDASARTFLEAWRQGRNFVTNGPALFLTVNDSLAPGDTLELPSGGGQIRVRARVVSADPLRSLTLIVNGEPVARGTASELDTTLTVREGAWIAAVATTEESTLSDADLARYRQESTLGGEIPSRLRFAHTSPVYVRVAGEGARVARSLDEARRMLDAFAGFARTHASPAHLPEITAALDEARRRLN
ncbi:CehA/McbA family metallohydrolase [Oleiharenicola lentus]|uniref:CehA/McbA family metallohydrolase n=1 Tax=Oleiharenicola lentus TaxID=2508720 RepID=UPI003F662D32